MPDWNTHVKWASRLGIDREIAEFINKLIDDPEEVLKDDPTELGELYRRDPEDVKAALMGHDWGRKGKARLDILKTYCRIRFGEKGAMAAELHHVLDYITHIRSPENLARIIVSSSIFHATSGKPLSERMKLVKEFYWNRRKYSESLERLTEEIAKLDYESYKNIIIELLKNKAQEWELHREVYDFVINNLDEILKDIDKYLAKKRKRIARSLSINTLDKWTEKLTALLIGIIQVLIPVSLELIALVSCPYYSW